MLKIKDATNVTPELDEFIKMVMQSFVGSNSLIDNSNLYCVPILYRQFQSRSNSLIDDNFHEQHARMKRAKLA